MTDACHPDRPQATRLELLAAAEQNRWLSGQLAAALRRVEVLEQALRAVEEAWLRERVRLLTLLEGR